jgi:hypothetical protein
MRVLAAFLLGIVLASSAEAQQVSKPLQVAPPSTAYDPAVTLNDFQLKSASKIWTEDKRGLNPSHTLDSKGAGSCWEDALTTGPYHQFCITHDAGGIAHLDITANNGAAPTGLVLDVNGTQTPLPGLLSAVLPFVSGNAALKNTPTTFAPVVVRTFFSGVGDAPPVTYYASANPCPLNGGLGDDGWQVKSADGKCWMMVPLPTGMPITVWGAKPGQNVDTPLRSAIAWACTTHVPVLVPYPAGNPYLLNSAITIGNGSATQNSTCNGVTLRGTQEYPDGTAGVGLLQAFRYNGPGGVIPINAQGPATAIKILDISVDCNRICATGFQFNNIMNGEFGGLGVYLNTNGPAFLVTSQTANIWQGAMEASWFHDMSAISPDVGGSGMLVGASSAANCSSAWTVLNNVFDRITMDYDGNTAGTFGIKLQLANLLTFNQTVALPVSGALGASLIVQEPTGVTCTGFPTDIKFSHSQLQNVKDTAAWAPVAGGIEFDHWSPVHGDFPTATRPGNFWGTDSRGTSHPGGAWVLSDTSGASLALTVTDARFRKSGGLCTVEFNITYPTTANGAAAQIGPLPLPACLPLFTASSVVGAPFLYTNLGAPVSLVCNAAGQCSFYDNQTSSGYTNAGLSGKNFRFAATYITQP